MEGAAQQDASGTILFITDDRGLSSVVCRAFRARDFGLECESDLERGLKGAVEGRPRLVLLDAALAGLEVLSTVRQLRYRTPVPLIVVTPVRTDLVAILESGADDCVAGAVEPEEVVARARAVLRRGGPYRALPGEAVEVGSIRIEPASRVARVDGITIDLTATEYDILEYLAREAGRTVSRDELMAAVCRREASPLDRALDVHISHLRRKLHRHAPQILTVRGVGYMLTAALAMKAR